MKAITRAIQFMTTFLVSCLAAVCVGVWLDSLLHTAPLILLLLLAYAIFGSFYKLWKGMNEDE